MGVSPISSIAIRNNNTRRKRYTLTYGFFVYLRNI